MVTEEGTRHLTGDEADLDEIVDKAEAGDLEIDIDHADNCPDQFGLERVGQTILGKGRGR